MGAHGTSIATTVVHQTSIYNNRSIAQIGSMTVIIDVDWNHLPLQTTLGSKAVFA